MGRARTSANLQSLKANDPASAPTLPGHGSTNPPTETEMNSPKANTEAAPAAIPDVVEASDQLAEAKALTLIVCHLLEDACKSDPKERSYTYPLCRDQVDMLLFAANKAALTVQFAMRALGDAR